MRQFTLCLAGLAFAGEVAYAQTSQAGPAPASSVIVYGRLDVSVNSDRYSGAGRTTKFLAVSSDSSILGFRGYEDLGGGLRAYFKMEHWLNADTGAQFSPTTFWNREAYVGIGNANSFGSIQLGSQYMPALWLQLKTDPYLRFNNGAAFTLTQAVPGFPRGFASTAINAVQYISPSIGGFQARAVVGAAEGAVTGKTLGGGFEYIAGELLVGIAYDRVRTPGSALNLPGVKYRNENFSAGAKYNFGVVSLHAYYLHNKVDTLRNVDAYLIGATVPMGLGEIRTSYTYRNAKDALNSDASLVAAGYFYYLSKRTSLYTSAARLINKGSSRIGLWPSSGSAAAQGLPLIGQSVTGLQLGIRHAF